MSNKKQSISNATREVMDFILKYKTMNCGASPSIREIRDACDLHSTSVVQHHLTRLQAAGWIERDTRTARNIRIVGETWSCPFHIANV